MHQNYFETSFCNRTSLLLFSFSIVKKVHIHYGISTLKTNIPNSGGATAQWIRHSWQSQGYQPLVQFLNWAMHSCINDKNTLHQHFQNGAKHLLVCDGPA